MTNTYDKFEAEQVARVFDQFKQKFLYSDEKLNGFHKGDFAVTVKEENNVISQIAALNWYVSRGFFIKCPKDVTYIVVNIHHHENGIYFMFFRKGVVMKIFGFNFPPRKLEKITIPLSKEDKEKLFNENCIEVLETLLRAAKGKQNPFDVYTPVIKITGYTYRPPAPNEESNSITINYKILPAGFNG